MVVQKILTTKLVHDRKIQLSVYNQDLIQEQLAIQKLIVELKGRNGEYQECHEMLEKQSKLIANIKITSPNFPVTLAMHWEQAILKDQLSNRHNTNCNTLNPSIYITPEVITKLEQMTINPSGMKLIFIQNESIIFNVCVAFLL